MGVDVHLQQQQQQQLLSCRDRVGSSSSSRQGLHWRKPLSSATADAAAGHLTQRGQQQQQPMTECGVALVDGSRSSSSSSSSSLPFLQDRVAAAGDFVVTGVKFWPQDACAAAGALGECQQVQKAMLVDVAGSTGSSRYCCWCCCSRCCCGSSSSSCCHMLMKAFMPMRVSQLWAADH
jgi:hypothetical protein